MLLLKIVFQSDIVKIECPQISTLFDIIQILRNCQKISPFVQNERITFFDEDNKKINNNQTIMNISENQQGQRVVRIDDGFMEVSRMSKIRSSLFDQTQQTKKTKIKPTNSTISKTKVTQINKSILEIFQDIKENKTENEYRIKEQRIGSFPEAKTMLNEYKKIYADKKMEQIKVASVMKELQRERSQKSELSQSYLQQSQIMQNETFSKKNLEKELQDINKFLQQKLTKGMIPSKGNKKMTILQKLVIFIDKEKKESQQRAITIKTLRLLNHPQKSKDQITFLKQGIEKYSKKKVSYFNSLIFFKKNGKWVKRQQIEKTKDFIILFRAQGQTFGIFSPTQIPSLEKPFSKIQSSGILFFLDKKQIFNPKKGAKIWKCSPYQFMIGNKCIYFYFSPLHQLKLTFEQSLQESFEMPSDVLKNSWGIKYPSVMNIQSMEFLEVEFENQ